MVWMSHQPSYGRVDEGVTPGEHQCAGPGLSVEAAVTDDQAMDLDDLSKPELAPRAAFPGGVPVDLRSGALDEDDPVNAGCWGADRVVRAEVVMALLLGAGDLEKGRAPAIRLVGARISGRLDVMAAG